MVKCPSCGEENPPKFRLCGYCGTPLASAPPAPPPREVRKTVTLLFSDLQGSTALGEQLDAEALHEVKERYFAAMAAQIAQHGGKIEKYIGDAIMAVFGLPRASEDDALRAVRAAAGMQAALSALNIELTQRYGVALASRTGVNTGEVVANDAPGADQKLATGDAVNLAARLEQAAPAGEVYLGDVTFRLVRDAVDAEPVPPLALKGKSQPVPAYRLVRVHGADGLVRRHDQPLVGRDDELAALRRLYEEAVHARVARMATLIGDAGAGKSRLALEVVERVAAGARVLRGRCLAYGHGVTFWPLRVMLAAATGIREHDSVDQVRAKLLALVGDRDVADRLASAAGWGVEPYPVQEIGWAARKFLERLAADGPVVAFIDDIHWAERAFLDLLEHVLDHAAGSPILLLATARHDLLEQQPQWGERDGALRIVLRPLSDAAAARVIDNLLGSAALPTDVMASIVGAAEGNPLYAEQMLSMLIEGGTLRQEGGRWVRADAAAEIVVPPTIQALLEARLDRLARDERATVEPAAVVGLEFAQQAVEWLLPEALRVAADGRLAALARKQFVRPTRTEEAQRFYRFQHHLIRDVAYNGLLKRTRAELHLAFVGWADRVNADRERAHEYEAILGYHLEQATRYLRELGPLDEKGIAGARDGARRLGSAGRRAAARGDGHAAVNLLARAAALLPIDDLERLALLPDLGDARTGIGDFAGARAVLEEAEAAAARTGGRRVAAAAQVASAMLRLHSGGDQHGDWSRDTLALAEQLIPMLELEQAHDELATAWRLVVMVHGMAGRFGAANDAVLRSIEHARRAGNHRLLVRNAYPLAVNALQGATPVPQAIAQVERLLADGLADRQIEALVLCALAQLKAMDGSADEARALIGRARAMLRDLGQGVFAASSGIDLARVALRGGDLADAERELRADLDFLLAKGETYMASSMWSLLARLVREQGRLDEALFLTESAEHATADDDVESAALWRMVRAPLLAAGGRVAEAEALAREGLALAGRTEAPILQADAWAEVAAVLRSARRFDAASDAAGRALALYSAKGDRASAARMGAG